MTNSKGFTLIELMVAVSIISILTVVGLVNYQGTLKKARDSRRQADLEQLRGALELYRSDAGVYPTTIDADGDCETPDRLEYDSNVYMNKVPCDPQTKDPYGFTITSSGYLLGAVRENPTAPSPESCAPLGVEFDYCVANP